MPCGRCAVDVPPRLPVGKERVAPWLRLHIPYPCWPSPSMCEGNRIGSNLRTPPSTPHYKGILNARSVVARIGDRVFEQWLRIPEINHNEEVLEATLRGEVMCGEIIEGAEVATIHVDSRQRETVTDVSRYPDVVQLVVKGAFGKECPWTFQAEHKKPSSPTRRGKTAFAITPAVHTTGAHRYPWRGACKACRPYYRWRAARISTARVAAGSGRRTWRKTSLSSATATISTGVIHIGWLQFNMNQC